MRFEASSGPSRTVALSMAVASQGKLCSRSSSASSGKGQGSVRGEAPECDAVRGEEEWSVVLALKCLMAESMLDGDASFCV